MSEMQDEEQNHNVDLPQDETIETRQMYVTVVNSDGRVITPIPAEALSAVQETLKSFKAVPVKTKRSTRTPAFPAVTSNHTTPLPATDSFLVLSGGFGANVAMQASLLDGEAFDLTTPVGKLRVQGQTSGENTSLQNYVTSELGPEGFKETAALLDIYDLIAGGQDQAQNVEITAKQVLQRMGKGDHADDNDLQAHLVGTLLYLARTLVLSISVSGASTKQARISPLLVLESVTTDDFGNVHLKYHLGEETFESIYGRKPQLYPLPTTRLVGYHGTRSRYEILLTQYLGNRLGSGEGISLYFVTLCTHSGLLTLERLLPSQTNRMRDAQQVISALVQLEQDGYIRCNPHPDLDKVIMMNHLLGIIKAEQIAPSMMERFTTSLPHFKRYSKEVLTRERKTALQRLLNIDASREDRSKENPEFCTRLNIVPGEQFLSHQRLLLTRPKEQSSLAKRENK
ncbi:MAG: hypothetical protein NVSMB38_43930 [Ktedonobacteraceae bacterium]